MSSMMSSVVVLAVLAFVTPVFNFIPVAALAAHLIRVGVQDDQLAPDTHLLPLHALGPRRLRRHARLVPLPQARHRHLRRHWRLARPVPQEDQHPYARRVRHQRERGPWPSCATPKERPHPEISIIHVEGELFFGAADLFQEQVRSLADNQNIRVFILRMKNARHLDASTVMALENLHDYLRETGPLPDHQRSNPEVTRVLENSGLLEQQIGRENIFPAEANATMATRNALKRAKELLPGQSAELRVFYDKKPVPSTP
jgi:SulP family sulfate permease